MMPGYIVGTMKGKVIPTNLQGAMKGKVVPTNLKVGPNKNNDLLASLKPTDNDLLASLTSRANLKIPLPMQARAVGTVMPTALMHGMPMASIPGPDIVRILRDANIVRTRPAKETKKEWLRKFADTAADAGLKFFIDSARAEGKRDVPWEFKDETVREVP